MVFHSFWREETGESRACRFIRSGCGAFRARGTKRVLKYATYDPRLGKNTYKAFNFSVKQLIAQKKMKKPFPPEKYFDLQFINRTMKQHPEWFKDLPPAS
jgi:hypothetical protein